MYEDQAFYAKVCLTETIFVSAECLDRYRQHPGSNCSVAAKTGYAQAARLHFLNWLATYMSERGVEDDEVWQSLHRELWFHSQPTLPKRAQNILRWIKKWLLRLEEWSLPPLIRG
jgi:hypothetical protein